MEVFEEIKLVRAREEDAERLAEISKRAFHSDIHCGAPKEQGPPGYDSPKAQISFMKNCDYFKILYDDVIVGALMVLKKKDQHTSPRLRHKLLLYLHYFFAVLRPSVAL